MPPTALPATAPTGQPTNASRTNVQNGSPLALIELPRFLVMFLVVRGVPALLLYRRELSTTNRRALALYMATELPILVAISQLGLQQGQMRPETASAVVGAGMLSVFIYPLGALSLRKRAKGEGTMPDIATRKRSVASM